MDKTWCPFVKISGDLGRFPEIWKDYRIVWEDFRIVWALCILITYIYILVSRYRQIWQISCPASTSWLPSEGVWLNSPLGHKLLLLFCSFSSYFNISAVASSAWPWWNTGILTVVSSVRAPATALYSLDIWMNAEFNTTQAAYTGRCTYTGTDLWFQGPTISTVLHWRDGLANGGI